MDNPVFRVTTADRRLASRWHDAFAKEGWEASFTESAGGAGCPAAPMAEVDLVEVGTAPCRTPEELHKLIVARKPVATLAFSPHHGVSCHQMARFLDAGADDFIFSDIDERVLVSKIKAYLRRLAPVISEATEKVVSTRGDVRIDRAKRRVEITQAPEKEAVLLNLTQKEMEILALLVRNEKQVVPREAMLEKLWGCDATEVYSNCINKHIEILRKKLGPFGRRIKTVYGSGYMFS